MMLIPRLTRPPRTDTAIYCRWLLSWYLLPGVYLTISDFQYTWSRERKIHIDLGRGEPARRQINLILTTAEKGEKERRGGKDAHHHWRDGLCK